MLYLCSSRGVAQSGRVLGLGPRCRRFESFRPDQKIQTTTFVVVLIFSKKGRKDAPERQAHLCATN